MNSLIECAEKAQQAAAMAADDVRELHRVACECSPLAEILVFDLIANSRQLADRLARIVAAIEAGKAGVE